MSRSDFDPGYQNQHTESKIVASLERISQAFRVLLWEESKEFALSPLQVQVLVFLLHQSEEKRKVSYLSEEFNVTKATISDTIKALVQKKMVLKKTEAADTRSYSISLTAKGKTVAEKASLFTREIRSPIAQLAKADQERLLQNLLVIIQHLNKTGIVTVKRMCSNCAFYRLPGKDTGHFCGLLNQELHAPELRIDCPEHQPKP